MNSDFEILRRFETIESQKVLADDLCLSIEKVQLHPQSPHQIGTNQDGKFLRRSQQTQIQLFPHS